MPEQFLQGGWTAPSPTSYAREAYRTSEKMSSGPRGLKIPAFLPYYEDQTGEVPIMRKYYRRMLADPVVKAALLGKVVAVIAQDLQIHPVDETNDLDKEVAEFCRWNLVERLVGGVPHLGWNVLIGMLVDGLSVVEPIWRVEDESSKYKYNWVIAEQKAKDVDNDFVLDIDEFNNTVGVRGLRFNAGDMFDPRDFIIQRYMPFLENPGGMSDLRAAYGRYWVLDTAWKLRAAGLERRSLPILWGTYLTDSQKPGLEAALAMARYSNWISTPENCRVEALEIAGQSQDHFRNAIQDLREEIFLAIQGAMLQALTGGQGTERGNSKVHESTANLLKWWLSQILCSILNDHENGLIKKLVRFNYGAEVEIPRATLDAVDDMDLAQSLTVDEGLHQLGIDLSKSQLYKKYGRMPPKDEEDTLPGVPQQPPPGAGAPGMGGGLGDIMGGMGGGGDQVPADQAAGGEQPEPEMPATEAVQDAGGEEQQQFTDQNMFTGKMRRLDSISTYAEKLASEWNRRRPSRAEMNAMSRRLRRYGEVVFHDGKVWKAAKRDRFNPKVLRVA